jgi:hypothetical protein
MVTPGRLFSASSDNHDIWTFVLTEGAGEHGENL